ncbi:MAG: Hpt domain-containing protein [Pirellula sp.]
MSLSISVSQTNCPLFDRDQFLVRCMGNQALSEKLIAAAVSNFPAEMLLLEQAIQSGNMAITARLSHRMRGTAANICAVPMSQSAHGLEQAAVQNQPELVLEKWIEFQKQVEALMDQLASGAKPE